MTIVPGQLSQGRLVFEDSMNLNAPARWSMLADGGYRFGIRANEISPVDQGGIPGRVTFGEVSGSETFLHVATALGEAVVQLEGVHPVEIGCQIGLAFTPERMFIFEDSEEGALLHAPGQGEG